MGLIYCATNKVNGKKYIGQTRNELEVRIQQHINSAKRKTYDFKFQRAILHYGEDSFEWEVLEDNIEKNAIDAKEVYYVDKYNTYKDGYNSTMGGDYFPGVELKYSDKFIKTIIEDICNTDLTYQDIAHKNEVTISVVFEVAYKRSRASCWEGKDNPRVRKSVVKYQDTDIKGVIKDIQSNLTSDDIIKKRKVSKSLVNSIKRGLSHRDKWDDFNNYWNNRENFKVNMKKERKKHNQMKDLDDDIFYKLKEKIMNTDKSYTDLAKEFNLKRTTVDAFSTGNCRAYIWGDDVNPRIKKSKYSKEDYEKVFKMYYIQGFSMREAHHKSGLKSMTSVRYFLKYKIRHEWFDEFKNKYREDMIR